MLHFTIHVRPRNILKTMNYTKIVSFLEISHLYRLYRLFIQFSLMIKSKMIWYKFFEMSKASLNQSILILKYWI